MTPRCEHCGENVKKINQQVSVMRKEIKNLRQTLDGAVRAHRKHLMSLQTAMSKIDLTGHDKKDCTPSSPSLSAQDALEQGRYFHMSTFLLFNIHILPNVLSGSAVRTENKMSKNSYSQNFKKPEELLIKSTFA
ncbi:hypothetical protein XENOCAPTIV_029249 [Xenoophorus captivus]|uniref:Uncharacterized protein n=2 Tax=Goodeidae TaxID=28758 RepID=A0ABV0R6Q1_9TELE